MTNRTWAAAGPHLSLVICHWSFVIFVLRARQKIRCAFWRAAPFRAAARRPAGCVARPLHTAADAAGMLVARALPAGLGASSKMYTLFPDGPLPRRRTGL